MDVTVNPARLLDGKPITVYRPGTSQVLADSVTDPITLSERDLKDPAILRLLPPKSDPGGIPGGLFGDLVAITAPAKPAAKPASKPAQKTAD